MPALIPLMQIYMVIPTSSAICERGFSSMKRIKYNWRSSLAPAQLQRLMSVAIEGPDPDDFKAEEVVKRWW